MTENGQDDRKLLETLKDVRPFQIVASCDDGTKKILAVPQNRRKKWDAVMQTIAGLAWTQLELQDAEGKVIGLYEPDEVAGREGALETLRTTPQGELAAVIVQAQDMALGHYHRAMQTIVQGFESMAKTQADRLERIERQVCDALELAEAAALKLNPPPPEEVGGTMADRIVGQVAAVLIQKYGHLLPGASPAQIEGQAAQAAEPAAESPADAGSD